MTTATKGNLEEAVRDIWEIANEAEGSRSGMQDALDQIQERCAEVVPEVEGSDDDDVEGPEDDD